MHDAKLPALSSLDAACAPTAALRADVGAVRIPVDGVRRPRQAYDGADDA